LGKTVKIMNQLKQIKFQDYIDDANGLKKVIKIAMIGPSQVGKTSMIAALLDEAKLALAQTNVLIAPSKDEAGVSMTQQRINKTILQIEIGLDENQFIPTGTGTAEPFIYDLQLSIIGSTNSKPKKVIRFAILDYPGEWLHDSRKPEYIKDWENCNKWIEESSILMIPVDANLVMQPRDTDEKIRAKEILGVDEAEDLIELWAKKRWLAQQSALLLFVPVKCETYFNDNGGAKDESKKLHEVVITKWYDSAINLVKETLSNKSGNLSSSKSKRPTYRIEYHPIDTIGCIEVSNAIWKKDNDGNLSLDCQYLVRGNRKRKPFGATGLLTAICTHILVSKDERSNPLNNFWKWLTGEAKLLKEAIEKLSKIQYTSRVKLISKGELAEKNQ